MIKRVPAVWEILGLLKGFTEIYKVDDFQAHWKGCGSARGEKEEFAKPAISESYLIAETVVN